MEVPSKMEVTCGANMCERVCKWMLQGEQVEGGFQGTGPPETPVAVATGRRWLYGHCGNEGQLLQSGNISAASLPGSPSQ